MAKRCAILKYPAPEVSHHSPAPTCFLTGTGWNTLLVKAMGKWWHKHSKVSLLIQKNLSSKWKPNVMALFCHLSINCCCMLLPLKLRTLNKNNTISQGSMLATVCCHVNHTCLTLYACVAYKLHGPENTQVTYRLCNIDTIDKRLDFYKKSDLGFKSYSVNVALASWNYN